MDLQKLSDDGRRRLAVLGVALLVAIAAMAAGVLGVLRWEAASEAAVGIALAGCGPVLVGSVFLARSTWGEAAQVAPDARRRYLLGALPIVRS